MEIWVHTFFISRPNYSLRIPCSTISGRFKQKRSQISKHVRVEKTHLDNIDRNSTCARHEASAFNKERVRSSIFYLMMDHTVCLSLNQALFISRVFYFYCAFGWLRLLMPDQRVKCLIKKRTEYMKLVSNFLVQIFAVFVRS